MPLETGTVLNKIYRVVKLLGKGAMGNVYLVERINDDKQFVVKELIFTKATGIDENTARDIFHREAEFMGRFNNLGLPKTYGIFSQDNNDYLVMDYIEGKTLEEIITSSDKPLAEDRAIKWTIELCEIIDYLHNSFEKPIVYRDLKPSNIIITPEGKAKLVDFGIARYYNPDKNTDTFSYGSPGYAAPEQYKGKGQSSPQSDVFGLGVILFQMLTKYDPTAKPFTFPAMDSLNPAISGKLTDIITRAVQLEALKRYISAAEFKETLEKYMDSLKRNPDFNCKEATVKNKRSTFLDPIMILAIIIILAVALFYSIPKKRTYPLIFCEGNLKNMGVALEMYAMDHNNLFPPSLDYLTDTQTGGAYMKTLPECKERQKIFQLFDVTDMLFSVKTVPYTYIVSENFKNYTIFCSEPQRHIEYDYVSKDGCWPQYNPTQGVIDRP